MLPELREGGAARQNALKKEFSSGDNVLSLTATAQLLKRSRLMVEDRDISQGEELLR
jgi:hypothetical protein